MVGAYLISPDDRTVSYISLSDVDAIDEIIKPDYGVTTVQFNKFGDSLHFDAERSARNKVSPFNLTGYIAPIFGTALITGVVTVVTVKSPVYDLEQITNLVRFRSLSSVR